MKVSVLWRCPYYGGVRTMEVSVLWRCPYYEGRDCKNKLPKIERCPCNGSVVRRAWTVQNYKTN